MNQPSVKVYLQRSDSHGGQSVIRGSESEWYWSGVRNAPRGAVASRGEAPCAWKLLVELKRV